MIALDIAIFDLGKINNNKRKARATSPHYYEIHIHETPMKVIA